MKRFLVLFTLLLALAGSNALADDKKADHGKTMTVDQKLDKISQELNLTADQRAQLKPILEDQMKQYEAISNDTSLSEDAKKGKKMSLKKSFQAQMQSVLTAEQRQKWEAMSAPKPKP